MSDAAIANVVTGIVTITTLIIGFLTLWVKAKYGVEKTEELSKKVDDNTSLTEEVKTSADKASQHVEGCDERMKTLNNRLSNHESRIAAIEQNLISVLTTTEVLTKNIDSTRNELRTLMQTVFNKLDLVMLNNDNRKE